MPLRYGLLHIPAPTAKSVSLRFAPLSERDLFNPAVWPVLPLTADASTAGWWLPLEGRHMERHSNGFDPGYADLARAINYATSHDVTNAPAHDEPDPLGNAARARSGRRRRDQRPGGRGEAANGRCKGSRDLRLHRAFGVFALILTSVGIPMFLAGEEFGDIHDTDYNAVYPKQKDPVQWPRAFLTGHATLLACNAQLIALRTRHVALQRNEIDFFYFHPSFDGKQGLMVFAYARTAGTTLESHGQVIAIANMSTQAFPAFNLPEWPWGNLALIEAGYVSGATSFHSATGVFTLALDPFQVRVFSC